MRTCDVVLVIVGWSAIALAIGCFFTDWSGPVKACCLWFGIFGLCLGALPGNRDAW
jgi:hypothetical protein